MRFNVTLRIFSAALVASLALLFVSIGPAHSADRDTELFRQFFNSPEHQAQVRELILKDEERLTPNCKIVSVVEVADFFAYESATFGDSDDRPSSGRWIERYTVSICGKNSRRTVYFEVHEGNLTGLSFLPGFTELPPRNLTQIMATSAYGLASAELRKLHGKDCNEFPIVTDTRMSMRITRVEDFLSKDPKNVARIADNTAAARDEDPNAAANDPNYLARTGKHIWIEDWYFSGCDAKTILELTFVLTKDDRLVHIVTLKRHSGN